MCSVARSLTRLRTPFNIQLRAQILTSSAIFGWHTVHNQLSILLAPPLSSALIILQCDSVSFTPVSPVLFIDYCGGHWCGTKFRFTFQYFLDSIWIIIGVIILFIVILSNRIFRICPALSTLQLFKISGRSVKL